MQANDANPTQFTQNSAGLSSDPNANLNQNIVSAPAPTQAQIPNQSAPKSTRIWQGLVVIMLIVLALSWYYFLGDKSALNNHNQVVAPTAEESAPVGQISIAPTLQISQTPPDAATSTQSSIAAATSPATSPSMAPSMAGDTSANRKVTLCYSLVLPPSANPGAENDCNQYINLGYDPDKNYLGSISVDSDTHSYSSLTEMVNTNMSKMGLTDISDPPVPTTLGGVPAMLVVTRDPNSTSTIVERIYVYNPGKYEWRGLQVSGFEIMKVIDQTDPQLTAATVKAWQDIQSSWQWL